MRIEIEPIPEPEPNDEPWWNNGPQDVWADIVIPKDVYEGIKLPILTKEELEKN